MTSLAPLAVLDPLAGRPGFLPLLYWHMDTLLAQKSLAKDNGALDLGHAYIDSAVLLHPLLDVPYERRRTIRYAFRDTNRRIYLLRGDELLYLIARSFDNLSKRPHLLYEIAELFRDHALGEFARQSVAGITAQFGGDAQTRLQDYPAIGTSTFKNRSQISRAALARRFDAFSRCYANTDIEQSLLSEHQWVRGVDWIASKETRTRVFDQQAVPVEIASTRLDQLPLALSIETMGGLSVVVVRRQDKLPKSFRLEFDCSAFSDTSASVRLFLGERPIAKRNVFICDLFLRGGNSAGGGLGIVVVRGDVNAAGKLSIMISSAEADRKVKRTISLLPLLAKLDTERLLQEGSVAREDDQREAHAIAAQVARWGVDVAPQVDHAALQSPTASARWMVG